MDQIDQYKPPPNPAKITDSRSDSYIAKFGESSWELGALEPTVLTALVEKAVNGTRDPGKWDVRKGEQEEGRVQLQRVSAEWDRIVGELEIEGETHDE